MYISPLNLCFNTRQRKFSLLFYSLFEIKPSNGIIQYANIIKIVSSHLSAYEDVEIIKPLFSVTVCFTYYKITKSFISGQKTLSSTRN